MADVKINGIPDSNHKSQITVADWHEFNESIVQGDIDAVRQWIMSNKPAGVFFNSITPNVRNPLCTAAEHGMSDIVDLLIGNGFSLKTQDIKRYRDGPLHLAAFKGHFDLVKKMVEVHKEDVNSWSNGYSVLQRAVVGNQGRVVQYLLEKGADPNLVHPRPNPPRTLSFDVELRFRCRSTVKDVVKDSLEEADQCLLEYYLLNIALHVGHRDIAYMLLHAGARYTQAFAYCVETFCLHRVPQFHVLMFLLEIRAPILYQDPWITESGHCECSPLTCAARDGNLLPVTIMLKAGCHVKTDVLSSEYDCVFRGPYENEIRDVLRQWLLKPRSLQDLCNFTIRRAMDFVTPDKVRSLPVPSRLKKYVRLEHLLESQWGYS